MLIVLSLCFIGRQVLSWRRSSSDRRQQLKWLAGGGAFTLVCAGLSVSLGSSGITLLDVVGGLAWFGWAALPVSIGLAILRYRLYDIDRIISRTLAYAIVTGLPIGVYAGLVLLATQALPVGSRSGFPRGFCPAPDAWQPMPGHARMGRGPARRCRVLGQADLSCGSMPCWRSRAPSRSISSASCWHRSARTGSAGCPEVHCSCRAALLASNSFSRLRSDAACS
jgi:hypothetical protein